ncbi:MAG: carboxypeptidase regulatory-like domain-containing protein [Chloroflexi bacterium]|nr:carboxypeptidase regulatory-like domain-containing protein [Chloroflexota bacterium]
MTWTPLSTFKSASNTTAWTLREIPLNDYAGQTITLCFRADLYGAQFWSGDENHCGVPGCDAVTITVIQPTIVDMLVQVFDHAGNSMEGINVYAFADDPSASAGKAYTGHHQVTNENGEALFTMPEGEYTFRADYTAPGAGNSAQFWSTPSSGSCWGVCPDAEIIVSDAVTVTVLDTDSTAKEGLNVYAFDGTRYTGYHNTTNADGQAVFTLPFGSYRFRADLNGTQFWSDSQNHCNVNEGCETAGVTVTKPVTVTVQDQLNTPYPDLPVYAFNGTTYAGYHGTTDANGQVVLTLPIGEYRFRADFRGTQFWSNTENHCTIPGCETAQVGIPGGFEYGEVTIDYSYDPLYRLTQANYSTGDFYHYEYDAVGNRLTRETFVSGLTTTNSYTYDIANRLVDVEHTYRQNMNWSNPIPANWIGTPRICTKKKTNPQNASPTNGIRHSIRMTTHDSIPCACASFMRMSIAR